MDRIQKNSTVQKYYLFLENFEPQQPDLFVDACSLYGNNVHAYQQNSSYMVYEQNAYGSGKDDLYPADNHLSSSIDLTTWRARYDNSVKELLADPQVLSRILKGTMEEVQCCTIAEIMEMICDIQISKVRTEPGYTNQKPFLENQEDLDLHGFCG